MQRFFLFLAGFIRSGIIAAETLSIAPDGNFMQDGKPVFLLGPVNMNQPYSQQGRYPFDRGAPKEWQWLYNQDVSEEQIRRLGGKIWATSPERTFLHVFDPRYSGPVSNRQAALENFTVCCAKEFAADGVTVNNLVPGVILTDRNEKILRNEAFRETVRSSIPLGRFGSVSDMAGAALLLCGEAGAYITGIELPVTGGMHL